MDGNENTERSSGPMMGTTFHKNNLWQEKGHILHIGGGENTSMMFTDYGNLGVKLDVHCGVEQIGFLIKPSEVDKFLTWMATTGCREILAMPPQTRVLLDKVKKCNKKRKILDKQESAILFECLQALDKMVLIRVDEVHDELVIEAGGR